MIVGLICCACGIGAAVYAGYLDNLKKYGREVEGLSGKGWVWLSVGGALNLVGVIILLS